MGSLGPGRLAAVHAAVGLLLAAAAWLVAGRESLPVRGLFLWVAFVAASTAALFLVLRRELAGRAPARPALFEEHPAPMLMIDPDSARLVDVNPAAVRFYGRPREQLRGLPLRELNSRNEDEIHHDLARAMSGQRHEFHFRHRVGDGSTRDVKILSGPVVLDARRVLVSVVVDETEEKRLESLLLARERLLSLTAQFQRAIAASPDERALLAAVCRTLVDTGGLQFAWVGQLDADGHVRPVAKAGEDHGYVEHIDADADRRSARSRGPTGQALRSGHAVVTNDFLNDPGTKVWHDAASKAGFRASAAFPLLRDGHLVGALNVYAASVGVFDDALVATLEGLTRDLSTALGRAGRNGTASAKG